MSCKHNRSSPKSVHAFGRIHQVIKRDKGYTLPLVTFLLVLLATVGFAVLSYLYLLRNFVIAHVHQVRAENAAQSEIFQLVGSDQSVLRENGFPFFDGSSARVESHSWGLLEYVFSKGKSVRSHAVRVALVGEMPSRDFGYALKFCNPQHQLVFTGFASIKGNVIVGKPGVTTGNLRDFPTPRSLPIDGPISKEESPSLPPYNRELAEQRLQYIDGILHGEASLTGDDFTASHSVVYLEGRS